MQWRQLFIALGVSLTVALLLNWAILKLFGQKSAARAEHSLIGIILLMAYVSRFMDTRGTRLGAVTFFLLALVPCYLGTVFPDLDITLWASARTAIHCFIAACLFWCCGGW